MKTLRDILYKVKLLETSGDMDTVAGNIQFDSRKVNTGSVFVAVRGTQVDGHEYISSAIEKGAVAIVCEKKPETTNEGICWILVEDSSRALGIMAANFYNNPAKKLTLVGVTGTNGKTTVATLLHKLFCELGYDTGLLSTVENKINQEVFTATHTTGDAVTINNMLGEMVKQGCTHCFMEVSSHAIDQNRVYGLDFNGGIFTNISHDHLDYHKTFDAYIKAKKKFFDDMGNSAFSLSNADDKRGAVMLQNTKSKKAFYAIKTHADYKGRILENTLEGLQVDINGRPCWFSMVGEFNAYNLLAVYATADLLGEDTDQVLEILSALHAAKGRFEKVISDNRIVGIVDYAHTPDALLNVLKTIHGLNTGGQQIITVVGCGGNRDKEKRPKMANIAAQWSTRVVLTNDNPRDENPLDILQEMEAGISPSMKRKVITLPDRKEAIKLACTFATTGDVILIAGKGHENYQEKNGVRTHFDDREVLEETFRTLKI